jgi:hypothetical protein
VQEAGLAAAILAGGGAAGKDAQSSSAIGIVGKAIGGWPWTAA